jgi:hypothetical protein
MDGEGGMSADRKFWSEEEWAHLQRLRAQGESWSAIDEALGRKPSTSRAKWENERGKERARAKSEARTVRPAPAEHQSLTASFFGDPLPGRSALDRRQSVAATGSISAAGGRP